MHVVPEAHNSNADATSTACAARLTVLGRVGSMFSAEDPGVHVLQGWAEAATCFQLVNYTLNTVVYTRVGSHSAQDKVTSKYLLW